MNRLYSTINNRYKLVEIVGEGGMNTVYKAEDLVTGDLVAIKILKPEFKTDKDVLRRFHIESQAIQKLYHENIVKVLDTGEENEEHFIVMELMRPHTLKDVISNNKKYFNNEDIIEMAIQMLSGIKIAHDNGIVHRDIKPQNILINEEGTLKVSDFGIARVVTSNTLTNNRDAIGSVHYASPEQSRGSVVDIRSDIYSFGIVLYEISTGRLPFDGDSAISIAMKHSRGEFVAPTQLNLNLNPSIEAIIKKCVQKEPSQRFQSVDEMIDLFKELREHPDQDFGDSHKELLFIPTETINMASIRPYLDGDKEPTNKVNVNENAHNKINIVPMVITVTAAVAIGILVLALLFFGPNREVESIKPIELDKVVGMNFTEASNLLSSKKINLQKVDSVYDDEVPVNHIISQTPNSGAKVKEGSSVKVVVSLGKKEIDMPNFVGKQFREAKVSLHNLNIGFRIEEKHSDEAIGIIIEQSPKAGTSINSNENVVLTMSLGPEPQNHVMPNLLNMHIDNVNSILDENNLIIGITSYEPSDTVPENHVSSQSIAPKTIVKDDTVVNLVVSSGEATEEEEPNGENPNGDEPNGDEPNGDEPNGDEPNGDEPNGDEPNGDEPNGDKPNGDEPNGDEPNGDEPNGDNNESGEDLTKARTLSLSLADSDGIVKDGEKSVKIIATIDGKTQTVYDGNSSSDSVVVSYRSKDGDVVTFKIIVDGVEMPIYTKVD